MNKAQVAVAGILAAGILLAFALSDYAMRQKIDESNGRAKANVTGGEVTQVFFLSLSHRLRVEYGPEVVFRVPRRFYYFAQEQGFVTVRYVSEDPLTAVIDGVGPFYPTLLTVSGMLIVGSVCAFAFPREPRRRTRSSAERCSPQSFTVVRTRVARRAVRGIRARERGLQDVIVPHPHKPGTLVAFVALPTIMYLVHFVLLSFGTTPVVDLWIINDPYHRYTEEERYGFQMDTANVDDLAAAAAAELESDLIAPADRAEAVRALALWTSVCPNYARFTVPVLVAALQDPEPMVKGAAAIGLGSLAGHADEAVPALRAAWGTSVNYFDYLLTEAILMIEGGQTWLPENVCDPLSLEEFEWRKQNPIRQESPVRRESP